jgi:cell division protein FtsB
MARGRKKDIEKQQMYLVKLKKYIAKKEKQIKKLHDGQTNN